MNMSPESFFRIMIDAQNFKSRNVRLVYFFPNGHAVNDFKTYRALYGSHLAGTRIVDAMFYTMATLVEFVLQGIMSSNVGNWSLTSVTPVSQARGRNRRLLRRAVLD